MATEAAVSNSAEDVSNLPNEDEQIFPIRTEKIEDNVETIEDVTVTVCHDDDGATEKADVTATVCNDDNDDDGATTEKEVVDENTTPNDGAATEKKEDENTTEEEDYSHLSKQDEQLSPILSWTTEDVAEWITKLGFPFYKNCFICNGIDGRKLILCNTSTLCKLGIADFKHLKFIAKEVRDLLKIGEPNWNVSIADIPRDIKELYLEQKSQSGTESDNLKLVEFAKTTRESIWQPPLSNLIQCITHNGPHDNNF